MSPRYHAGILFFYQRSLAKQRPPPPALPKQLVAQPKWPGSLNGAQVCARAVSFSAPGSNLLASGSHASTQIIYRQIVTCCSQQRELFMA